MVSKASRDLMTVVCTIHSRTEVTDAYEREGTVKEVDILLCWKESNSCNR